MTFLKKKIYICFLYTPKGPPVEEEAQESARSKWGAGGAELRLAEKSLEEPEESARSKWGAGFNLRQMTLEETASQMEGKLDIDQNKEGNLQGGVESRG